MKRGEVVIIIGPSGSGKSTFIRTINRLERHERGQIIVDGIPLTDDVRNIDAVRRHVGMVAQSFNLFPHMSALSNITLAPTKGPQASKQDAIDEAMHLLDRVGIPDQAHKYPNQLSAASSNAWPSPGHSQCTPTSCCSMSPRLRWTPKWSRRS